MNEGGQSSTGQLIDFVINTHPAYPKLLEETKKSGKNTFDILEERLTRLMKDEKAETLSPPLLYIADIQLTRSASHERVASIP